MSESSGSAGKIQNYPYLVFASKPKTYIQHFDSVRPGASSSEDAKALLGNGFNLSIGVETGSGQLLSALKEKPAVKDVIMPSGQEGLHGAINFDIEDFVSSLEGESREAVSNEFFKLIIKRCDSQVKNKRAVMNFLNKFRHVFTTNYDTVLYFLMVSIYKDYNPLGDAKRRQGIDGFGRLFRDVPLKWRKGSAQDYFYLHGALHMYKQGGLIYKREREDKHGLAEILSKNLDNHLSIFQASCKEDAIKDNKYLLHCYEQLKSLKGPLYIVGWRCATKDAHLAKAIRESSANPIYISVCLDSEKHRGSPAEGIDIINDKEAVETIRNFRYHFHNKQLEFFDIKTIDYLIKKHEEV